MSDYAEWQKPEKTKYRVCGSIYVLGNAHWGDRRRSSGCQETGMGEGRGLGGRIINGYEEAWG